MIWEIVFFAIFGKKECSNFKLITLFFAFPLVASAAPDKVDVIFLSPAERVSFVEKSLYNVSFSSEYVENKLDCVPMGDKCFHPQLGLIDNPDSKNDKKPKQETPKEVKPLKTLNSLDSDVLDCKEGNYFDIYCGKAKKSKGKKSGFEIWVDTSSSMRNTDYEIHSPTCYRKGFIEKLRSTCPKDSFNTFVYDSSKRELAATATLCHNTNQNNSRRLIQWIKDSTAKHVLIITDAEEMNLELEQLLDQLNSTVHGIDSKMLAAKSLKDFVSSYSKTCQKFKP